MRSARKEVPVQSRIMERVRVGPSGDGRVEKTRMATESYLRSEMSAMAAGNGDRGSKTRTNRYRKAHCEYAKGTHVRKYGRAGARPGQRSSNATGLGYSMRQSHK